ncbi:hypothetical protein ACOSQ3_004685 [Xanthoceras sorbifolium]
MKCCSLKCKDLNFHYKKMVERLYMLNGYNDESLTQVYINSLPDELHSDLQRQITATQKLCDTQKLLTKMIQNKKKFDRICLPHGQMKLKSWWIFMEVLVDLVKMQLVIRH